MSEPEVDIALVAVTAGNVDVVMILDIFVLLLIGIGPKVAVVPFLDLTADMDSETRTAVAQRMIRTAMGVALILVVLGSFLMELLHFSENALFIAGGIVFFLLALRMLTSVDEDQEHEEKASERKPMEVAVYPLAIPYLLNPVGITLLVIFSATFDSLLMLALLVFLVLLVGAFDWLLFTNMDVVSSHLDESRLAVTEAVFGVLLAALAVELVLEGLSGLGVV